MEQRRTRRFKLELPLSITRSGAERVALAGLTKNISSRGVLFTAETEPGLGRTIEYVITLNQDGPRAVNLHCIGTVVRAEPADSSLNDKSAFQIAATLERYEFVPSVDGAPSQGGCAVIEDLFPIARSGPCEPRKATNFGFADPNNRNRG